MTKIIKVNNCLGCAFRHRDALVNEHCCIRFGFVIKNIGVIDDRCRLDEEVALENKEDSNDSTIEKITESVMRHLSYDTSRQFVRLRLAMLVANIIRESEENEKKLKAIVRFCKDNTSA